MKPLTRQEKFFFTFIVGLQIFNIYRLVFAFSFATLGPNLACFVLGTFSFVAFLKLWGVTKTVCIAPFRWGLIACIPVTIYSGYLDWTMLLIGAFPLTCGLFGLGIISRLQQKEKLKGWGKKP